MDSRISFEFRRIPLHASELVQTQKDDGQKLQDWISHFTDCRHFIHYQHTCHDLGEHMERHSSWRINTMEGWWHQSEATISWSHPCPHNFIARFSHSHFVPLGWWWSFCALCLATRPHGYFHWLGTWCCGIDATTIRTKQRWMGHGERWVNGHMET